MSRNKKNQTYISMSAHMACFCRINSAGMFKVNILQCRKSTNFKPLGGRNPKGPEHDNQNRPRSPMPEGGKY
jgi:hypothetical protein